MKQGGILVEIEKIFSIEMLQFRTGEWVLLIPLICIVVDFATGVLHAWSTGHLKSYKMRQGLARKSGELLILILGEAFTYGMSLPVYILWFLSGYIIFMELVSIIENLRKMGIKIPKFIEVALEAIDETIDKGGRKDE